MKLNLDIISDHLPKSYPVRRYGSVSRNLSLKRPLLYESGCEFEKDRLYVARADTLPKTPPRKGIAVVCVDLRPPQDWISGNCQILLVSNGPGLFTLFNDINKIYDKFDEWDNNLRNELEADIAFNPQKIIITGIRMLENPIFVCNGSMLIIFHSEILPCENNQFNIKVRDDYIPLSVEESERIKDVCRLERVISVPYMSSYVMNGVKSYCNNLYPFGHFAGCISMTETHRLFRESDYALADYFFAYFQKAYAKYLQNIRPVELPGTIALNNLLNNIPLSTEESKMLSLNAGERWICFKLKEKKTRNFLPADYMYTTLSALMSDSVYSTVYDESIIGLIKLNRTESVPNNDTLNFFQEFLNKMEYIAGLSNEFNDIKQINIYLQMANYAVEKGSQIAQTYGRKHMFYFSDYMLQYMVSQCTGDFAAEYLYSKGLHLLIEHDKNSKTNYVDTLYTYLKHEMSITTTASALFLHRSSLLKRLGKIKKILGMNLEDSEIRLYLRMCLNLIKKES